MEQRTLLMREHIFDAQITEDYIRDAATVPEHRRGETGREARE